MSILFSSFMMVYTRTYISVYLLSVKFESCSSALSRNISLLVCLLGSSVSRQAGTI